MLREPRPQRQQPPAETRGRQPDARRDLLQNQIIRDLAEHVSAVEDGVDLVQLGSGEVQVFFHAADVGVVEVRAVQVVDPVHEADVGEDEPVDFEEEVFFFPCGGGFAPDCYAEGVEDGHRCGLMVFRALHFTLARSPLRSWLMLEVMFVGARDRYRPTIGRFLGVGR